MQQHCCPLPLPPSHSLSSPTLSLHTQHRHLTLPLFLQMRQPSMLTAPLVLSCLVHTHLVHPSPSLDPQVLYPYPLWVQVQVQFCIPMTKPVTKPVPMVQVWVFHGYGYGLGHGYLRVYPCSSLLVVTEIWLEKLNNFSTTSGWKNKEK